MEMDDDSDQESLPDSGSPTAKKDVFQKDLWQMRLFPYAEDMAKNADDYFSYIKTGTDFPLSMFFTTKNLRIKHLNHWFRTCASLPTSRHPARLDLLRTRVEQVLEFLRPAIHQARSYQACWIALLRRNDWKTGLQHRSSVGQYSVAAALVRKDGTYVLSGLPLIFCCFLRVLIFLLI